MTGDTPSGQNDPQKATNSHVSAHTLVAAEVVLSSGTVVCVWDRAGESLIEGWSKSVTCTVIRNWDRRWGGKRHRHSTEGAGVIPSSQISTVVETNPNSS